MEQLADGRVPTVDFVQVVVVDCRSDDRYKNNGGHRPDPRDAKRARSPGPYPPGVEYFQFHANAANSADSRRRLTFQAVSLITDLFKVVMKWTSEG